MIRHAPDAFLSVVIGLLVAVGFMTFMSASFGILYESEHAFLQSLLLQSIGGLLIGGVLLFICAYVPPKVYRTIAFTALGASIVLTLAVYIPHVGISVNGARRWIEIFGISIQPSEFLKIGAILGAAALCVQAKPRAITVRESLPTLALLVVVSAMLLAQPDTDTLLVIAASIVSVLFVAGIPMRVLVGGLVCLIIAGAVLVSVRPYLLDRVQTFFDPSRDPQGSGYQLQQSFIAIGSGQLLGKGYAQGVQKYAYLPEPTSDSIFAVYAEEFGFVGSVFLVLLYLLFALRGYAVAARAADAFSAYVAVGIVTGIITQTFLNILSMTGMIPLGGLTLPFVSRGGSALIALLVMCGILLSISRYIVRTQRT